LFRGETFVPVGFWLEKRFDPNYFGPKDHIGTYCTVLVEKHIGASGFVKLFLLMERRNSEHKLI